MSAILGRAYRCTDHAGCLLQQFADRIGERIEKTEFHHRDHCIIDPGRGDIERPRRTAPESGTKRQVTGWHVGEQEWPAIPRRLGEQAIARPDQFRGTIRDRHAISRRTPKHLSLFREECRGMGAHILGQKFDHPVPELVDSLVAGRHLTQTDQARLKPLLPPAREDRATHQVGDEARNQDAEERRQNATAHGKAVGVVHLGDALRAHLTLGLFHGIDLGANGVHGRLAAVGHHHIPSGLKALHRPATEFDRIGKLFQLDVYLSFNRRNAAGLIGILRCELLKVIESFIDAGPSHGIRFEVAIVAGNHEAALTGLGVLHD